MISIRNLRRNLGVLLLLAAGIFTTRGQVVINEIMYHPLQPAFGAEPLGEEFIELFNAGTNVVDLAGWHFSKGMSFTFTNATLQPGGYLVVTPNLNVFKARYPGVGNVVGNWQGQLSNNGETITLQNATDDTVDEVAYASDGDWGVRQRGPNDRNHRGWKWYSPADGLGNSMERRNPFLAQTSGQNWGSSAAKGGSPGKANAAFSSNIAPLILEMAHSPVVPRSNEPVAVTARIVDEQTTGISAVLVWHVDGMTQVNTLPMLDDGQHGDGAANDGVYGAVIPAQLNNAVVEFYVRALDAAARAATWPGPVVAALDNGSGPTGQVANALYQVDDNAQNRFGTLSPTQPVYKLIMLESERAELAGIPCSGSQESDAEMNGTFISLDGIDAKVRYLCGFRNRGHGSRCANPPNYHINFPTDHRWNGVRAVVMNIQNTPAQVLASVLERRVGVPSANTHAGQVRVNNANLAGTGASMLGAYAILEQIGSDWAENHFPEDDGGNIYRAVRDIGPANFNYRGTNVAAYTNTYYKGDNTSAYDWSDLIRMHRIMGTNDLFSPANIRSVVNVEEWMSFFAVQNILGNNETSPNTGYNDDYFMYRGVNDPRFILINYDNDTMLSEQFGARSATSGIFTAENNNGMGEMTVRFMEHPEFKPRYYAALQRALDTAFSQAEFNATVDQVLGTYPATSARNGVISSIKAWMETRRATIQAAINGLVPPVSIVPVAAISGEPRNPSPSASAALIVGGAGVTAYRYALNGGAYSAEMPVSAAISLTGLPENSTNTVSVIGRNAAGVYQELTNATVSKTWVVKTSTPRVRLNEILARNDVAVNHNGSFPDLVELYNESPVAMDLSGMRLTDEKSNADKFVFPAGTTIPANGFMVLYANNPDGTPGIHLGFSLKEKGDEVCLYDANANLLDSVRFGLQLADKSLGRFGNGDWVLCQPTFGGANSAQSLGDPASLRINEWLLAGQGTLKDGFVELFNLDSLPVALSGLYLTTDTIGAPAQHQIAPLSFAAAHGFTVFIPDGNLSAGPEHLNFTPPTDMGEIGLNAPNLSRIDVISYGPQRTGIAEGRCGDGEFKILAMVTPTPGSPNLCPALPPAPITVNFLPYNTTWKFFLNPLDGVAWAANNFNDSGWAAGAAVLGRDSNGSPPEPLRTTLPLTTAGVNGNIRTYYFRTTFNMPANANISGMQISHFIDDGAIVYLNGVEAYRYNMPGGSVNSTAFSQTTISGPPPEVTANFPMNNLVTGLNYLAVELHQSTTTSGDFFMGIKLDGIIVTNTPTSAGIVINEVFANNQTIQETDGATPKWVELYNPSSNAVDLGGGSFSDTTLNPRRWVFPTPSLLPAKGYTVIRFDADAPATANNTGFGLKSTGDAVYLFSKPADGGGLMDFVVFGLQAPDFSIGRIPNGGTNWSLTLPSAGSANSPAPVGNTANLKVNEWMANAASGEDSWFEIYNPDAQPVAVGGYWLSDDLGSSTRRQKYQIPTLSYIGGSTNGYQQFWADGNVDAGADHVNFGLKSSGEAIGISAPNGSLINGYAFSAQENGVSEGRFPDGSETIARFPGTESPGDSNYKLLSELVVSEVLSHTDPPLEDAVEFQNLASIPVDISGWFLSDTKNNLKKFTVPAVTVIPAGGFKVFYEEQFGPGGSASVPFAFSSAHGNDIYLSQAAANGQLTGFRVHLKFDAAQNGVSFGRYMNSVGKVDYPAMSALTFGTAVTRLDPTNMLTIFRTGQGASNSLPRVGPVIFNEIMFQPPALGSLDNERDEFIELKNISNAPVPLYDPAFPTNHWRIEGAVSFEFPSNVSIPANGTVLVVSFDPNDTTALNIFKGVYAIANNVAIFGPWNGKLSNDGEKLELYRPDTPNIATDKDPGFVPFLLVEKVTYSNLAPWPVDASGTGKSLQRQNGSTYGNEPNNWIAAAPTADPGTSAVIDTDADGIPDDWERGFGLNPNDPSDARQDADGDGLTNLQEYQAGTNPSDPRSSLGLVVANANGSSVTIQFNAVQGLSYSIQMRSSLATGSWTKIKDFGPVGTTGPISFTDSIAGSASTRFYRLVTPQIP